MRESQVEAHLRRGVERGGGWCIKLSSPGNAGVPDRLIILPGGRLIFVELKAETGRLTALQTWTIQRMEQFGVDIRVLKGLEAVKEFLREVMPSGRIS